MNIPFPTSGRLAAIPRVILLSTIAFVTSLAAHAQEITKEQTEFFETKIRPILADTCYRCHSADAGKSKGGLTLDSRDAMLDRKSGG